MASSFWSSTLTGDDDTSTISDEIVQDDHIAIKRSIPSEETHELAIDIYETEERVYVVAPLAGVKSKDISISIDEATVHIKGSRINPFEEHENKLYSSECFWGKFERKFTLPNSVDTRDISATFRNGVLLIEASRIAPAGSRNISIH